MAAQRALTNRSISSRTECRPVGACYGCPDA